MGFKGVTLKSQPSDAAILVIVIRSSYDAVDQVLIALTNFTKL
jgi:hypothetical protein